MSKILGWFFLIVMMLAGDSIVMARPNVVVIMTDDQDDSGSITTMPSVQELAKNGVTFRNSFVDFPLCTPSRATFMTGQTAHNNEILGNNFPWVDTKSLLCGKTIPWAFGCRMLVMSQA